MFKRSKKMQSPKDTRKVSDSSQSDDSSVMSTEDSSQPIDPSALPSEWSPNQKIYPDDVNAEPESIGLQFNDPGAKNTEWEFVESDGADSSGFILVNTDNSRLEFRSNTKFPGIVLMGCGIVLGSVFVVQLTAGRVSLYSKEIFLLLFGLAALVVGFLLFLTIEAVVFDKCNGEFRKGWTLGRIKKIKCSAKLADIYAIQLIDEWCEDGSSNMNYQLNLVLNNSSRVNVFEGRKHKKIREVAKTLSGFLSKPVWDAT